MSYTEKRLGNGICKPKSFLPEDNQVWSYELYKTWSVYVKVYFVRRKEALPILPEWKKAGTAR